MQVDGESESEGEVIWHCAAINGDMKLSEQISVIDYSQRFIFIRMIMTTAAATTTNALHFVVRSECRRAPSVPRSRSLSSKVGGNGGGDETASKRIERTGKKSKRRRSADERIQQGDSAEDPGKERFCHVIQLKPLCAALLIRVLLC